MLFAKGIKTLLIIVPVIFGCQFLGQSTLSKKQRYDSLVQEGYRLQYEFLNLLDADSVADIGTGGGYNLSRIASHFPSVHFVAEDIDSNHCNKDLFITRAKKNGNQPNMDNVTFHIGTETSTNLSTAAFTKVLAFDVIHEWTYKTEMLADIKRILKQGSPLLISEILVYKKRKKARTCRYPFLTEPELKGILVANGFQIVREQFMVQTLKTSYVKLFECRVAD